MPQDDPNLLDNHDPDFLAELAKVETAIADLKYRYRDVQNARRQRQELLDQKEKGELGQELTKIAEKLQELAIDLESKLLTDTDLQKILRQLYWEALKEGVLREWFWQIIRFGGLGVIVGWILKSCAG